jgi:hypothetical protein
VRFAVCGGREVRASRAVANLEVWTDKGKRVDGLLSAFVTALFIGDMDLNNKNLALVDRGNSVQVTKIDSECAFTNPFFNGDVNDMTQALHKPGATENDQGVNTDFAHTLWYSVQFDEERLKGLLHTQHATVEKFVTIQTILGLGADPFIAIIERCVSDQYQDQKQLLCDAMRTRVQILQQAAEQLPGFVEWRQTNVLPQHALLGIDDSPIGEEQIAIRNDELSGENSD